MPARCFVAVELSPSVVRLLGDARRGFEALAPGWESEKWVRPQLLHLTLSFIGALPDSLVASALVEIDRVCTSHQPFGLSLTGVRAVPSPARAEMLWATLEDADGDCARLVHDLDAMLAGVLEKDPSDRAFRPHVTIARARRRRRAPIEAVAAGTGYIAAGKAMDRTVSVHSVTLYSSMLGPGGPVYESLGPAALGE